MAVVSAIHCAPLLDAIQLMNTGGMGVVHWCDGVSQLIATAASPSLFRSTNKSYHWNNDYSNVLNTTSCRYGVNNLSVTHMADIFVNDIFKRISLNGSVRILIGISLNSLPSGGVDSKSTLIQIMAWRRICNKPLSEAIIYFSEIYMRH